MVYRMLFCVSLQGSTPKLDAGTEQASDEDQVANDIWTPRLKHAHNGLNSLEKMSDGCSNAVIKKWRDECHGKAHVKAAAPVAFAKLTPWYAGSSSDIEGYLPLTLAQSILPASTITPPMAFPCPHIYFVSESMTMWAPCSTGRHR